MQTVPYVSLTLAGEELSVLQELLESERARLLVEIRHTSHRSFRDQLRARLAVVEHLIQASQAG